jgi:hypothetical protein
MGLLTRVDQPRRHPFPADDGRFAILSAPQATQLGRFRGWRCRRSRQGSAFRHLPSLLAPAEVPYVS